MEYHALYEGLEVNKAKCREVLEEPDITEDDVDEE